MNIKRKGYEILLIGAIYIFFTPSLASPATLGEIVLELTCPCGCNMQVSSCECGTAAEIKNEIQARLNNGQSKKEIIGYFVANYGEKILSSPTSQGFNLMAWILPFVAIIFGIGFLYFLLKRWISREKPETEPAPFKKEDKIYLERIEKELKSFES